MATKIRLQRFGRKSKPFFHVVVADSRSKRDGRYIEKLGVYNPTTNPATIDINFERAEHWVTVGAQPTDTVRALLSYTGVLLKDHLNRGVLKGALTEAQAKTKFEKWLKEKEANIQKKRDGLAKAKADATKAALAAEAKIKEARAEEILKKNSELVEAENADETVATVEETPVVAEEATTEVPASEETKVEEAPAEETETVVEEPKAESTEDTKENAPAEEEKKEA